jgi:hypothetical protein
MLSLLRAVDLLQRKSNSASCLALAIMKALIKHLVSDEQSFRR